MEWVNSRNEGNSVFIPLCELFLSIQVSREIFYLRLILDIAFLESQVFICLVARLKYIELKGSR